MTCSFTGGVKSDIGPKAKDLSKRDGKKTTGLYDHLKEKILEHATAMRGRQVRNSITPTDYAQSILPAVLSANPPPFVYGGSHVSLFKWFWPISPTWATDRVILVRLLPLALALKDTEEL